MPRRGSDSEQAGGPDIERDGAKVTMQTRVAVLDKTPHRFQVIPLREMLRTPSHSHLTEPSTRTSSLQLLKSPKKRPSRPAKLFVHLDDESGQAECLPKRRAASSVLQSKDQNRPLSEATQKKTATLQADRNSDHPSTHTVQIANESTIAQEFSPSHGFSQSLNQYSFRLKPWKSSSHLQISPRHDDVHEPVEDVKPDETAKGVDGPLSSRTLVNSSHDGWSEDLIASSTTLVDPEVELGHLPKLLRGDTKKRHAIYSHVGFPLKPDGFLSNTDDDGPSPQQTSATQSSLQEIPERSHPKQRYTIPNAYLFTSPHPGHIRPLRLTRNSQLQPQPGNGPVCHHEIILDLLQQVEEDITTWRNLEY